MRIIGVAMSRLEDDRQVAAQKINVHLDGGVRFFIMKGMMGIFNVFFWVLAPRLLILALGFVLCYYVVCIP